MGRARPLRRLRDLWTRRESDRSPQFARVEPVLAIANYDELSEGKIIAQLHQLSEEELAAVEAYERSHRGRPGVLEKLHYVRLGGSDATTVKALRDFERKRGIPRDAPERSSGNGLEALRQEATYHRERLELYRAKLYGGRAVSQSKLDELQRAADGAEARLRRAEAKAQESR